MGCCRSAAPNALVVLLVISLLALDRPIAHARPVKSPSMSTGEHPSTTTNGLQGTRKLGAEKAKQLAGTTVQAKGSTGEPSFGHGGSPEFAEIVVVARAGPRPHPKKHN
ncbi:hypothetical protein ACP4OV_005970 [Aristida adscensionis]